MFSCMNMCTYGSTDSLPDDKFRPVHIAHCAFNKIKGIQKLMFDFQRVENNVGKGENADSQHFLLFLHYFKRLLSQCH